jgi:signal transduction histidine kinase
VQDTLDLASLQAGRFSLNYEQVNIRQSVKEVIDLINIQIGLKPDLFLIDSVAPDVPACFEMDPQRLKQLLINLLKNASKFTFDGFIHLSVKKVKLLVTQQRRPIGYQEAVLFEVFDTGIGISKPNMKNLFKLFGKLEQLDKEVNKEGLGFGLYIVKQFIT